MKKYILSLISFLFILSSCSFDIGKKNEGSISFSREQIRTIINNARNQFEDFSSDEDGYLKLEVKGDFSVSKKLFFSEVAENDIETYNSFLTIGNIPVGSRVTVSLSLATKGDYVLFSGKSSEIIVQQGDNSVEIILKRAETRYPIEYTDGYILIIGQDNSAIVEIEASVTTYEKLEEVLSNEVLLNKLIDKELVTLDLSQTSISEISCSTRNEIIQGVSAPVKYSIFSPFDIVNLPTSLSVIGEYTFIDCINLISLSFTDSINKEWESTSTPPTIIDVSNALENASFFKNSENYTQTYIKKDISEYYDLETENNRLTLTIFDSVSTFEKLQQIIESSEVSLELKKNTYLTLILDMSESTISRIDSLIDENEQKYSLFTDFSKIILPNNVPSLVIGEYSFVNCLKLTDFISTKIASVGQYAFKNCRNLKKMIIPMCTNYPNAFEDLSGVTSIEFINISASYPNLISTFTLQNNIAIIKYENIDTNFYEIMYNQQSSINNFYSYFKHSYSKCILDLSSNTQITKISRKNQNQYSSIFADKYDEIILPDSVNEFEGSSFRGLTKLKSITIPVNVEKMGTYAFSGCTSLTNVIFVDTQYKWNIATSTPVKFIPSDSDFLENSLALTDEEKSKVEWTKTTEVVTPDWQTMQDVTSYNVGDLVLSNGKVFVYSNERTSYTFENGVVPVAVIFKAGNKNESLGLGLTQQENIQWVNSSFTEGNTTEYDYTICSYEGRTIDDSSYYGNDSRVYESNTDGSENWQKIYDNFPNVYPQLTNYPVFNFANGYGNTELLSSTDYKDGWYIPSTFELYTVYKNIDIVNTVLSMIETYGSVLKTGTGDSNYWTSSQYFNGTNYVDVLDFSSGLIDGLGKTSRCNVCVIRRF